MSDPVLAQAAYDAYSAARDRRAFNGDPLPQWDQVPAGIQAAWLAAVEAVAAPADQAARGVQQWMALDLHTALELPTNYAPHATNQGHPTWYDWWTHLLATARAQTPDTTDQLLADSEQAGQEQRPLNTPGLRPVCGDAVKRPDGETVTCGRDPGHPGDWHRRGIVSWKTKTVWGSPKGHASTPRTTTQAATRTAGAEARHGH